MTRARPRRLSAERDREVAGLVHVDQHGIVRHLHLMYTVRVAGEQRTLHVAEALRTWARSASSREKSLKPCIIEASARNRSNGCNAIVAERGRAKAVGTRGRASWICC
jgi:hypothetical protein